MWHSSHVVSWSQSFCETMAVMCHSSHVVIWSVILWDHGSHVSLQQGGDLVSHSVRPWQSCVTPAMGWAGHSHSVRPWQSCVTQAMWWFGQSFCETMAVMYHSSKVVIWSVILWDHGSHVSHQPWGELVTVILWDHGSHVSLKPCGELVTVILWDHGGHVSHQPWGELVTVILWDHGSHVADLGLLTHCVRILKSGWGQENLNVIDYGILSQMHVNKCSIF